MLKIFRASVIFLSLSFGISAISLAEPLKEILTTYTFSPEFNSEAVIALHKIDPSLVEKDGYVYSHTEVGFGKWIDHGNGLYEAEFGIPQASPLDFGVFIPAKLVENATKQMEVPCYIRFGYEQIIIGSANIQKNDRVVIKFNSIQREFPLKSLIRHTSFLKLQRKFFPKKWDACAKKLSLLTK